MAVGNGYQTGSANTGFYQNQLRNLISNPGSFQGSPGYGFAFDQAMKGVNAQNSTIRGSGNALAALQDRASGLAMQDYGNQVDRLGRLSGQEQQYDLGLGGLNNTAQGNADQLSLGNEQNSISRMRANNDFSLGQGQNQNAATRNANDLTLGLGQNANTAQRNANDLTLGNAQNANNAQRNNNDYNLGMGQNANTAQNNWWNYNLGQGQNANAAQANANNAQRNNQDFGLGMYTAGNNFALGQEQNANTAQNNWWNYNLGNQQNTNQYNLGMYNANTNRGEAQSNAYLNDQRNQREWYSIYPRQRLAGQP